MSPRIEQALQELARVIREEMLESLRTTLQGSTEKNELGFFATLQYGDAPKARAGGITAKGQKRDPKLIEATTEKLLAHIRRNPGERIEPIGKALGIPTKDLALPVKKLLAAKQIKTKGQRRATTYFAR
jgi:hypothetical protein